MDSSQQALQTNGKFFFSNFEFLTENLNFFPKELRSVNIDQIAMCYVSAYFLDELYKLLKIFFRIPIIFAKL